VTLWCAFCNSVMRTFDCNTATDVCLLIAAAFAGTWMVFSVFY
jgi:hypothetical protein